MSHHDYTGFYLLVGAYLGLSFVLLRALYVTIGRLFGYRPPLVRPARAESYYDWDEDNWGSHRWDDYNPATGLPMMGATDSAGNPYGINLHRD